MVLFVRLIFDFSFQIFGGSGMCAGVRRPICVALSYCLKYLATVLHCCRYGTLKREAVKCYSTK